MIDFIQETLFNLLHFFRSDVEYEGLIYIFLITGSIFFYLLSMLST